MNFEDRQGENLNRKKLTIVSKSDTEMIVDVSRADNETIEGTKINAKTFNSFNSKIEEAINTANMAYTVSSNALEIATKASKAKFHLEGNVLTITDIGE